MALAFACVSCSLLYHGQAARCRLSRQAAAGVSVTVGSTPFDDAERGEFVSEEFEALLSELAALGDIDFGPASDDDASDDDLA